MNFVAPSIIAPSARVLDHMPAMRDIPAEFRKWDNPWAKLARRWFFNGLDKWTHVPKPGIDHNVAKHHLVAIQQSFEPAHEHKTAAVAYLMSLWYQEGRVEEPKAPKAKPPKVKKLIVQSFGKPYTGPLRGGIGNDPARYR